MSTKKSSTKKTKKNIKKAGKFIDSLRFEFTPEAREGMFEIEEELQAPVNSPEFLDAVPEAISLAIAQTLHNSYLEYGYPEKDDAQKLIFAVSDRVMELANECAQEQGAKNLSEPLGRRFFIEQVLEHAEHCTLAVLTEPPEVVSPVAQA